MKEMWRDLCWQLRVAFVVIVIVALVFFGGLGILLYGIAIQDTTVMTRGFTICVSVIFAFTTITFLFSFLFNRD